MHPKNTVYKIIKLGRFKFLAGGFFLYTIGILLAILSGVTFSLDLYIFGYAIFLPAHLSMNYSNVYFDIDSDKYNIPTAISGGSKILIDNPELKRICLIIFLVLMILSISLTAIFIFIYNFSIWFFLFVLFGNLLGLFYAAPPIRLSYIGLGELANVINMGLIMPGFGYWILKGALDTFYFIFAIGIFFYGFVFIISVEIPDMEGDKKSNKKTVVVLLGRKLSYYLIIISLISASIYYFILSLKGFFIENINYLNVFFISLIPLIVAIIGIINNPFKRDLALKVATRNIFTLSFFMILIIIYLLFLII